MGTLLLRFQQLTLILLTCTIGRAPNNASKWQMGFNSAFKGLRNGLPSLNVAVPALKMMHVKDVQKVQQYQKSLNKCTIWYWMTGG
jgi:hypothetical protein